MIHLEQLGLSAQMYLNAYEVGIRGWRHSRKAGTLIFG